MTATRDGGIPKTSAGRVAVDSGVGAVAFDGGLPLVAGGELAITTTTAGAVWSGGLLLSPGGRLVVSTAAVAGFIRGFAVDASLIPVAVEGGTVAAYANGLPVDSTGRICVTGMSVDPTSIAGLQGWWKADALGLADGAAVSSWGDSSGNGRALVQATGASQPLHRTGANGINSLPAVKFDGTDDWLANAPWAATSQPNTIFLVGTMESASNNYFFDNESAGNRHAFGDSFGGANVLGLYAGAFAVTGAVAIPKPMGPNAWSAVFNGASSVLYKDGATYATGDVGSGSLTGLRVGAHQGGVATTFLLGKVAEILVYNALLSAANRQAVEAYLKAKWATP